MKVLIAVDESEHTVDAIKWYLEHHREGNDVILVHATDYPVSMALTYKAGMALPRHEWDALVSRGTDLYKALQRKLTAIFSARNITPRFVRVYGSPGPNIVDAAREEKVDLVVLGTRGMGRVRRTVLGSVSDYVLHHAHTAVTICRS